MRRYVFPSALFLPALFCLASAVAGTLTVNSTADHADGTCDANDCTLREAIIAAQPNEIIQFTANVTGTISLTEGQLVVDKSLTISGPGARALSISGNSASRIFAINPGVNATISGLSLTNGLVDATTASGGAILNQGNLKVTACSLLSNTVMGQDQDNGGFITLGEARGGAIYNQDGAVLTARNCTFASNNVQANSNTLGGGIWNGNATLILINCTLSGNTLKPGSGAAPAAGGGIFNNSGSVLAVNCTIVDNTYSSNVYDSIRGGGIYNQATCKLQNTIISDNLAASSGPDVQGTFTSNGFNLIGNTSDSSGWIASDITDGNAAPRNLTALSNNGGPTDTHTPQTGSIAVDNGSNALAKDPGPNLVPGDGDDVALTTDQRSSPRIVGLKVDIGAVELDPAQAGPEFTVNTTDDHDDGVCGQTDCSLRDALAAANADPDANIIDFKPGLTGTTIINSLPDGLSIAQSVSVNGPGARILAISGGGTSRVFNVSGGTVTLTGLTIRDGHSVATNGGGIVNTANLTLSGCAISNNALIGPNGSADEDGGSVNGGGIFNSGTLTINSCTFAENRATGGNGGPGTPSVTFGGRGGAAAGGAIASVGTLTMSNCTLTANTADGGSGGQVPQEFLGASGGDGNGGAVCNAGGALTVTNCTVNANSSSAGSSSFQSAAANASGGGIYLTSGDLRNSIIAGNSTSTAADNDIGGTPTTSDHNLIGGNPMLEGLANNGGPTDTMALLTGSPAINAGNDATAPKRDQRSYGRKGVSDIGAFELGGIALHIISVTRSGNNIVLNFNAIAGETYRLERKFNLASASWAAIGGVADLTASSTGPAQLTDTSGPIVLSSEACYRVRVLP
jgi:CSLREA domain-containing protein